MKRRKFWLTIIVLIVLSSCYIDWENPNEVHSLIPAVEEWIIEDTLCWKFKMLSADSILLNFSELQTQRNVTGYTHGTADFKAYVVGGEYYEQLFNVNGDLKYFVRLETLGVDHGDLFCICLKGTYWAYDFGENHINYVLLTKSGESESVFQENVDLQSSFEFLDSIIVNNIWCDSVLHFSLNSFLDSWNDETVIELYYAKHIGLVKFVQNNGVEYERSWE